MANTAQVNQPLIEHPLPYFLKRIVGAGSVLLPEVDLGQDYLVVPPPAAGPNGVIARDVAQEVVLVNNTVTDIPPGDDLFLLIYKNSAGDEVVIATSGAGTGLAAGESLELQPSVPFLLTSADQGVFLRRADAVAILLNAHNRYFDIRDVTRVSANLANAAPQTLLSGIQGKARLFTPKLSELDDSYAAIANFDSVDHNVEVYLSDGVNTIQITQLSGLVPAGTMTPIPSFAMPTLLEGWSVSARVVEDIVSAPCTAIFGYTDTNLSPVRSNQGGAY